MADQTNTSSDFQSQRLHSLDAYRGLIMVTLAFVGFGLAKTAANHLEKDPESAAWEMVRYQASHVQWVGCSYWDLIQPSFMFMVGVSMAYSYGRRKDQGDSYPRMLRHAISRSIILILLSIFLMSVSRGHTNWTFMNVLAQMGLAYTPLFLLWGRPASVQMATGVLILGAVWGLFEIFSTGGIDTETGAPQVGVTQQWAEEHLEGVRSAWHKNANVGHTVDVWLLNKFPRPESFEYNQGGYQTINFIPSLVTMLFGLMCGELLRSRNKTGVKLLTLLLAGVVGLAAGQLLHETGACPLVKRIWTPSWTLFSTGWCCLILATLYLILDIIKLRVWSFPLIVVGMNSIAIYCMSMTLKGWTARQLQTHLGKDIFVLKMPWSDTAYVDAAFEPTVQAVMVGLAFWLICFYMYRHKIFVRI